MYDTSDNPFVGLTLTSLNTYTDTRQVANETSTNTCYSKMPNACMNLDIATQRANLVHLQALKGYISARRGVLADGWHVKFEYPESICKSSPLYCAPNGRTFHSMSEVAHHLGLPSACISMANDNGSSIALLQDGSHATKNMEDASRSPRTDMLRVCKSMSQRRVGNGRSAVEAEHVENDNHGSDSSLDDFPVQFEDFFVMSVGKINPQLSFHNACQIWPIGYKSIWHDKFTGSLFVSSVLDGGDCSPIFRVNRYPCTKQSIPNASTVLYRPKGVPLDEIASCLTTQSAPPLQRVQHIPSSDFTYCDVIGEFSVEGRSPSSAWHIALETLLCACRQAFQDLRVLNFFCNHSVDVQHFYESYNNVSLDKFGYMTGPVDSLPNLIRTSEQLEVACIHLRKWLQLDRFGLDAEFVQELFERLPGVAACSEYIYLYSRRQNVTAHTVGSGFFIRKYNSQLMVSDSLTEGHKRPSPPGNTIASNLPSGLIGDVLQAYEFCLRFHKVLGLEAPLSSQNLENELLNPWADGLNSILSNFHVAMLKVLVEDMLAKVMIHDPLSVSHSKSRKGRKSYLDTNLSTKKIKLGIFPVNEITWPELARRYILVLLSMDQNLEALDITSREFSEIFRCLHGDGGSLCGSYTGMASVEADAVILAEASMKLFSSVKSKFSDFVIDKKDLNISDPVTQKKRTDNKCPEWIRVLEPVRKQATNVGARIRDRVRVSLEKQPPAWAKEKLLQSISKDVYKGNAAGPTKNIVVEVLNQARDENPLTKKKAKESRDIRTVSDVIIKRCRMVLRSVAAEDESKIFFGVTAESLLKPNESDDVGHPATFLRLLDFRIIDLRLDAGFYGDSPESFIEDVREVWQNLRSTYRNNPKYLDLVEKLSKKLEELYEQEVLALIRRVLNYVNSSSMPSDETKKELNRMLADTITTTLFTAPWEEGICKVCGKDENDHVLLLCDRCDAEYHTYCLDPPLQRVPKACWYCPSCISFIASQTMPQEGHHNTLLSQFPGKKRIQREFARSGLQALVGLADSMESKEYWELGVEERILLLRLFCDEALSAPLIRDHISQDGFDIQRNFLGQDSTGRLYWLLGPAQRLFVSSPYSTSEECVTTTSSSTEFHASEHSSWICYESDADVEALLEWLRDDIEKERELKQTIMTWQRNKTNDWNDNDGQVDVQVDHLRLSVHDTNARKALEKKFGPGGDEREILRGGCLEKAGSTQRHCFGCHLTFFGDEVHQCVLGKGCGGSLEPPEVADDLIDVQSFEKQTIEKSLIEINGLKSAGITGKTLVSTFGNENVVVVCNASLAPLVGRASEILRYLKIMLLDIEGALPSEAFRPSRVDSDRLRAWREFVKSARSIYDMVQATIILEDMIKTTHLRKEWWYWSSASTAAKISTISALALKIYALDAALLYEKPPPPPVDLTIQSPPGFPYPIYSTVAGPSNDSEPTEFFGFKKKLKSF